MKTAQRWWEKASTLAGAFALFCLVTGSMIVAFTAPPPSDEYKRSQIFMTNTGGSAGFYHLISAATNNSTLVASGARRLYSVTVFNTNAATAYVKFYNTVAAPTCQTDAVLGIFPTVQNIPLTAEFPNGVALGNGLGLCVVAGQADSDNTSATTGISVTITYR